MTAEQKDKAIVYLTDCTLATVGMMATKKSRPKGEYSRQISIAQRGVDYIKGFNISVPVYSRIYVILDVHGGSVEDWATTLEEE